MADTNDSRPIIIKRRIVAGGDAHHGGAWKVAYADFVTAMMAFFLLMWLLNATTEDQRKGLADYFNPSIPISRTSAGGTGMLSGESILVPPGLSGSVPTGRQPKPTNHDPKKAVEDDVNPATDRKNGDQPADPTAAAAIAGDGSTATVPAEIPPAGTQAASAGPETAPPPAGDALATAAPAAAATTQTNPAQTNPAQTNPGGTAADTIRASLPGATGATAGAASEAADPETARELAAERTERQRLEEIRQKIAEAMRNSDDGTLQRHFVLHITPEGLVIEIIDADDRPLFASASSHPAPVLKRLAGVLVPVLDETLNDIAVVGHTDAVPFGGAGYSNWELSADRANAARRLLIARGLPESRVVRVTGKAAVEPLVADPKAPQNRRIALILLREPAH